MSVPPHATDSPSTAILLNNIELMQDTANKNYFHHDTNGKLLERSECNECDDDGDDDDDDDSAERPRLER